MFPPAMALPHIWYTITPCYCEVSPLGGELSECEGYVLVVFIALVWHVAGTSQMLTELKREWNEKVCKDQYQTESNGGWRRQSKGT